MKKQKLLDIEIANIYKECLQDLIKYAHHFNDYSLVLVNDIKIGSVKIQDLLELNKMLNIDKIESFLEIGSFVGVSFRILTKMIQPKIAFSIDPNIPHRTINQTRKYFYALNSNLQEDMKIICHDGFWGESITPETFGRKFDCIFIDADHEYRSVQKDFLLASEVLEDNGIIILHDVKTWQGVKRFCEDIDRHYHWSIVRTPFDSVHDGFAIIFRTSEVSLPFGS